MTEIATSPTLIEKVKSIDVLGKRDESAWIRFIDHYCPIVHRLAKKHRLSREEAEVIGQEFVVQMLRSMPRFTYDPEQGRFRDFVVTVALNLIRKHWRRLGTDRDRVKKAAENAPSETFDERAWWESAERTRTLQRAVAKLMAESSARDRDLFECIVLRDEPVSVIVEKHGISANTWYGIKYRMLARLREEAVELEKEWQ